MMASAETPDTQLENTTCICHSPADISVANDVKTTLEARGISCKLSSNIDDFDEGPSTFIVIISSEFCRSSGYISKYNSRMLEKNFSQRVIPVVSGVSDKDLPLCIKSKKHLIYRQRNFIVRLIAAIQGGGIAALIPKLSLKIKSSNLSESILALLDPEKVVKPKEGVPTIHDLWEDVYQVSVTKVEKKRDIILVTLAVRDKPGIQKLALDSNDGTLKKCFIEKLVNAFPDAKGTAENLAINFDMAEYSTACEQLKEDEERDNLGKFDRAVTIPSNTVSDHQESGARALLEDPSVKSMSFEGNDSYDSLGQKSQSRKKSPPASLGDADLSRGHSPDSIVSVISGILFTMINKKDYSCYDFESQLNKLKPTKFKIELIISEEGTSLLHAIVLAVRPTFLSILFRNGFWAKLIHLVVDRTKHAQWGGLTAKEIAEKRGRSRKLLSDILYFSAWEKSMSDLHLAARSGDEKVVKSYVSNGASINEKDNAGATSLYWACVSGSKSLVSFLLEKNASPHVVTEKGETLLHVTTSMGHKEIVKLLLQNRLGLDPTVKDSSKKTPWERNGERGDIDTLRVYIEAGKEMPSNILPAAAFHGRFNYIKHVVENYSLDMDGKDVNGRNALLRATESGHADIVKYLVEKEMDLHANDKRARNIMHILADGGYATVMPIVIEKAKETDSLQLLINQRDKYVGGELCFLIRGKDKGRQAWHYVEVKRRLVHIFLKKTRGGSVDVAIYGNVVKSGWGPDPEQEIIDMIDKRFEERRQSNTTESDQTPLHIALFKSNDEIAQTLIENGADLSIQDCFGLTPMHIAAMRGNLEMAKLMDAKGASLTVEDRDGKTPLEVAEDNEHHDMNNFMKAKDYYSRSENFITTELQEHTRKMTREYLEGLRNEGKDIRKHLVDVLRDITIDVHGFLLDLGSGPVQEESSSMYM